MRKKVFIGFVCAALVLALAIPAFAAVTDTQKKDIGNLLSQAAELRKQILDKYVDAGVITKEQADLGKQNIDQATKYQAENPDQVGPGFGCGGYGNGMMGGSGFGGRGMMRGYNSGVNFNPAAGSNI